MPAPKVLALFRRKQLHNPRTSDPCYVVTHLELDGVVLCPSGKKLHAPGFWARFRKTCRNLRDHDRSYVMYQECMWCRWLMTKWEAKHPKVAGRYPTRRSPSTDLHLMSPTLADLRNDPSHAAFMADLLTSPEAQPVVATP